MPQITFEDITYECPEGTSILSCLQSNGVEVPSSCRAGVCQTCILQLVSGQLPPSAQAGLKDTLKAQGYLLSCVYLPKENITVARANYEGSRIKAVIIDTAPLNDTVLKVRLKPESTPSHRAGQFYNLLLPNGLARSYSIASVPKLDDTIDFQVARVPNGRMSGWLFDEAKPGDTVELLGPQGNCFYVCGAPEQPLLLFATGTGLAPVYGILRDALQQNHTGSIHLFQGSLVREELYLVDELRELATSHSQFKYHPCILKGEPEDNLTVGSVDEIALETCNDLSGWRVFLCGNPAMVKLMQRKAFMAGASMSEIFADAFISSP